MTIHGDPGQIVAEELLPSIVCEEFKQLPFDRLALLLVTPRQTDAILFFLAENDVHRDSHTLVDLLEPEEQKLVGGHRVDLMCVQRLTAFFLGILGRHCYRKSEFRAHLLF